MNRFNTFYNDLELNTLYEFCRRDGTPYTFQRGDYFAHQGKPCRHIGLVMSGYFNYATTDTSGSGIIVGFAFAGEFVTLFHSSVADTPSAVSIIAGTRSEVLLVPIDKFKNFLAESPMQFHAAISDALFQTLYNRYLDLYRFSPKERYLQLLAKSKDIINTVPLQDLASYLMITPQYLSRLRREITAGDD